MLVATLEALQSFIEEAPARIVQLLLLQRGVFHARRVPILAASIARANQERRNQPQTLLTDDLALQLPGTSTSSAGGRGGAGSTSDAPPAAGEEGAGPASMAVSSIAKELEGGDAELAEFLAQKRSLLAATAASAASETEPERDTRSPVTTSSSSNSIGDDVFANVGAESQSESAAGGATGGARHHSYSHHEPTSKSTSRRHQRAGRQRAGDVLDADDKDSELLEVEASLLSPPPNSLSEGALNMRIKLGSQSEPAESIPEAPSVGSEEESIGKLEDADSNALTFLARLLCYRYLLSGRSGALLGEIAQIRVAHRSLALQCLAAILRHEPAILGFTLLRSSAKPTTTAASSLQRLWDALLYVEHGDPLVRGYAARLVGLALRHFRRVVNSNECSNSEWATRPAAALNRLLRTLMALCEDDSVQCSKLALESLRGCLPAVLCEARLALNERRVAGATATEATDCDASASAASASDRERFLEQLAERLQLLFSEQFVRPSAYWLLKLEYVELLASLDLCDLFSVWGELEPNFRADTFVAYLFECIIRPLLSAEDTRVRSPTCSLIAHLVSSLRLPSDQSASSSSSIGATLEQQLLADTRELDSLFSSTSLSLQLQCSASTLEHSLPFLHVLHSSQPDSIAAGQSCKSIVDSNLRFVIGWLRERLVRSNEKLEVFSCVQTLLELSDRYAPSRHPAAWRLLSLESAGDERNWSAVALVSQVLRLARSPRFGLDLRFHAHAVLFASRLLHAIALHQASLRALALADTFRVATITQQHESSPPTAATSPIAAPPANTSSPNTTARWETMLHECYVREWWLLDEAHALTAQMDALLQHLMRLLALFPAVTEQTLGGIIVGRASAQQQLETPAARSSPSKSSKSAAGGSKAL